MKPIGPSNPLPYDGSSPQCILPATDWFVVHSIVAESNVILRTVIPEMEGASAATLDVALLVAPDEDTLDTRLREEPEALDEDTVTEDALREMMGKGVGGGAGTGTLGEGLPFPLGEGTLTEGTAGEGLGAARFAGDPVVGRVLPLRELGSAAVLLMLLFTGNDSDGQDFLPRIAL